MNRNRYTIKEITKLFYVSEKTVQRWVNKGVLPHKKLPSGRTIFIKKDIDEFFNERGKYASNQHKIDKFKFVQTVDLIEKISEISKIDQNIIRNIFQVSFSIDAFKILEKIQFSKLDSKKHKINLIDKYFKINFENNNSFISDRKNFQINNLESLLQFLDHIRYLDSISVYEVNIKDNQINFDSFLPRNINLDSFIQFKDNYFERYFLTNTIRNLYWDNFKNILFNLIKSQKYNQNLIDIERRDKSRNWTIPLDDFHIFLQNINKSDAPGLIITKYWIKVWYEREDLQTEFKQPHLKDQLKYLGWIKKYAKVEKLLPSEEFIPIKIDCIIHKFSKKNKFVYIGYLNSVTGLGEAARNNVKVLKSLNYNFSEISYNRINGEIFSRDCTCASPYLDKFNNKIVFVHINPDNLDAFFQDFYWLNKFNNYLVFIWAWEMENPSVKMKQWAHFANEIWAVSRFVAESIKKIDKKLNIKIFHHYFNKSTNILNLFDREKYVLAVCDFNSWSKRKNIENTVLAYLASKLPDERVKLKIKTLNLKEYPLEELKLLSFQKDNTCIEIIDKKMDEKELDHLFEKALIYISLHRSEGFGLNILKAMSKGTPVIVTNYSGNLDFCNSDNSKLVEFDLIDLDSDSAKIFGHNKWAEPDIKLAAESLNKLYFDRIQWHRLSSKAFFDFNDNYSFIRGSYILKSYLRKIIMVSVLRQTIVKMIILLSEPILLLIKFPYNIKLFLHNISISYAGKTNEIE